MRKLLLLIIILISLNVHAQKPWEKLKVDSTEYVEMYGTELQRDYQHNIEDRSSHKMLCLLTGAQYMWMYNLAYYIGGHGYNCSWAETEYNVIITATPSIGNTKMPRKMVVNARLNKALQITSVKITGSADDLINLFIKYWEITDISFNELKTNKQAVKDFVSDKVSYNWNGSRPVIVITKNTNSSMDIFPLLKNP